MIRMSISQDNEDLRRLLISVSLMGNKRALGYRHTEETKQKLRETDKEINIEWHTGRTLSDETKRKISEANKGNPRRKHSEESKRKMSESHKGILHSEESKRKMSESHEGKIATTETKHKLSKVNTGKYNPNWKGGISFEPYCDKFNYQFKEYIRDTYGRMCFLCGKEENGRKHCVHHVDYNKEVLCNGIKGEFVPLCLKCHITTNTNRKYWEQTIMEMLGGGLHS